MNDWTDKELTILVRGGLMPDVARVLGHLDGDQLARILSWLDNMTLGRVLWWLDDGSLSRAMPLLNSSRPAVCLKLLDAERLAIILQLMNDADRDRVLRLLDDDQRVWAFWWSGDAELAGFMMAIDRFLLSPHDTRKDRVLRRLGLIPVIDRPYSSLFAATAGEDYDQSTFGESCGTRGGVAWHVCRLAGDDGWALAGRLSIPIAATLILRRSGCQVLPDWYSKDGRAVRQFIEVMAARESQ
jgi:hypothetical protein